MKISIKYYYNRGGSAPGPALKPSLSHHHVISYPRMYYLGVLALCYLKRLDTTNQASIETYEDKLYDVCKNLPAGSIRNAIARVLSDGLGHYDIPEDRNNLLPVLYNIAWMPMNLFIGPSSKIRIDDPSQNYDKLPKKMPERQKSALSNIISGIGQYSRSYIPNGSGARGTVCFDNEADFNQLMDIFFEKIDGSINCYDSKISDWLIASDGSANSSSGRYNYYPISFYRGDPAKTKRLISRYMDQRQLCWGKFAVREASSRIVDGRKFKILEKGSEYMSGIVNTLDPEDFRNQDQAIQGYL